MLLLFIVARKIFNNQCWKYLIFSTISITIISWITLYFKENDALKNDIKFIKYNKNGNFEFTYSKSDIIRKESKETNDKKINNIYNIKKNKKALTKK